MTRTRRTLAVATTTALGAGVLLAAAPAASAATATASVEREKHGTCSKTSTWELGLEREHGFVEVSFDANTNRTNVVWRVKVKQNGAVDYKSKRVTDREGEFEVERLLNDTSGEDKVVVRAKNTSTGEICKAKLSI